MRSLSVLFSFSRLDYRPPTCQSRLLPMSPGFFRKACQTRHRAGEIGPMPLGSYQEVRPWASSHPRGSTRKCLLGSRKRMLESSITIRLVLHLDIDKLAAWADRAGGDLLKDASAAWHVCA